jgi:hypothetical protein
MRRWHLLILVLLLSGTAVALIGYKVRVLGYPLLSAAEPAASQGWIVDARMAFDPTGGAVKAELILPHEPPGYALLDENFVSRGYGLQTEDRADHRAALWSLRRPAGRQALYYRVTIASRDEERMPEPVPALESVPEYGELEGAAVEAVLDEVRSRSADIVTFSSMLVRLLASPAPDENVQVLLPRQAGREDLVRTAIHVLAGARIPARMVRGIRLVDGARELAGKVIALLPLGV